MKCIFPKNYLLFTFKYCLKWNFIYNLNIFFAKILVSDSKGSKEWNGTLWLRKWNGQIWKWLFQNLHFNSKGQFFKNIRKSDFLFNLKYLYKFEFTAWFHGKVNLVFLQYSFSLGEKFNPYLHPALRWIVFIDLAYPIFLELLL